MEDRESYEVELGNATLALAALLHREMDAIFTDLIETVSHTSPSLSRHRAVSANRIVLICRNLAEEVRRYKHLRWLQDDQDGAPADPEEDEIAF